MEDSDADLALQESLQTEAMTIEDNIFEQFADVPATSHRRRDWIACAQVWLPACAVAAAGLFSMVEWVCRGNERYSPGAMANVHAAWDDRCAACHTSLQPLNQHTWAGAVFARVHGADAQCQTCHAGPAHHANEIPNEIGSCSNCHREHRGRAADLRRVANEQCTRCHAALSHHVKEGATTEFRDVSSFYGQGHPEFRLWRETPRDPGKIAFNHKLHLAHGLREEPNNNVSMKLADIPREFRERYRTAGQSDQDLVKLDCASCHRTDGVSPRAAGDYMAPINYEKHCQACHPLNFAATDAKEPLAELPTMRHRLQPGEVRGWLRGYFTERSLKDQLPFLEQSARPLPGKNRLPDEQAAKIGTMLQARIEAVERILFGPSTCGKCHESLKPGFGSKQRIEPAGIPEVWLPHARFDHTAHRGVACQVCHANAEHSRTHADVLLPGMRSCQLCHAPADSGHDGIVGGARHDCVECHRYHSGDDPLHGRGAASRRPPGGAIDDPQRFLRGTAKP